MAFGLMLMLLLCLSLLTPLYKTEDATCTSIDKSSLLHNSPSETCSRLLQDFAKACGDFISCALNYSKPMCLCDACSDLHQSMETAYNRIKDHTGNSSREQYCKRTLFDSDHLTVVRNSYQFAKSLWTTSHCKYCNSSTQAIKKFYELLDDLLRCWDEFIIENIPIISKNDSPLLDTIPLLDSSNDKQVNHTICTNCSEQYHNFISYYKQYSEDHGVCGDIAQHLNMTSLQWSQLFKCDLPRKNLTVVGIIAGGFVALVIFFYCGVNLYGCLDEKKEKRLITVTSNSSSSFTDTADHSSQRLLREENALHVRHTDIN